MKEKLETYPDIQGISNRIVDLLRKTTNTPYSLALSGGNTPKRIFEKLTYKKISWNQIQFFWGDERCVPPDHSESNYKMAREHLFDRIKIQDHQIHRIKGENDPASEAVRYEKEIRNHLDQYRKLPVFDMIMLGLGEDGHTASIFPDQMYLLKSDKVCEIAIHPETGQKRITLTGPVIKKAKNILFIVTGKTKSKIIADIVYKRGDWKKYPASYITPENGELYWITDSEASSLL